MTVGSLLDQAWERMFELAAATELQFTQTEAIYVFIILVVGFVGGRITAEVVRKLLKMSPLDDMAVKANIQSLLRKLDYSGTLSDLIAGFTLYIIYLLAVFAVLNVLGLDVVFIYLELLASFVPKVTLALLAVIIGSIAAGHMESIIVRFFRMGPMSTAIDESEATMPAYRVVGSLVKVTGYMASILVAFSFLGVNRTAINLLIGIFGIGIMATFVIATAGIMRNLALSMYLQMSRVLKAGEWIEIEGHEGKVTRITPLHTVLDDGDDTFLVPNTEMIAVVIRKEG